MFFGKIGLFGEDPLADPSVWGEGGFFKNVHFGNFLNEKN